MPLADLKNKCALKGTYIIVKEASGLHEYYLIRLTESISVRWKVGFGHRYEKQGMSYVQKDQVMV